MTINQGIYRLVGMDGHPHPVLDTPYDSIDAAIGAAKEWTSTYVSGSNSLSNNESSLGIEVMTSNGSWRTILYS